MSVQRLAQAIIDKKDALSSQGAMEWRPDSWRKWLGDREELDVAIDAVEAESLVAAGATKIDRAGVRRVAAQGDSLRTFVASQVWGHGTNGNGPWRVAVALGLTAAETGSKTTYESSLSSLQEAYRLCKGQGGVAAYRYMVNEGKLPWLGPAFITKYLFFIQDGGEPKPLILDALVRRVIETHARDRLSKSFGRTVYYKDYLELVDDVVTSLSEKYERKCMAEDVETALFRIGSTNGQV